MIIKSEGSSSTSQGFATEKVFANVESKVATDVTLYPNCIRFAAIGYLEPSLFWLFASEVT